MLDAELAEIVANLRLLGTDIADVEVKNSRGGLPKSLRETLSSFSNTRGGVVVLGLDEARGFAPSASRTRPRLLPTSDRCARRRWSLPRAPSSASISSRAIRWSSLRSLSSTRPRDLASTQGRE